LPFDVLTPLPTYLSVCQSVRYICRANYMYAGMYACTHIRTSVRVHVRVRVRMHTYA